MREQLLEYFFHKCVVIGSFVFLQAIAVFLSFSFNVFFLSAVVWQLSISNYHHHCSCLIILINVE